VVNLEVLRSAAILAAPSIAREQRIRVRVKGSRRARAAEGDEAIVEGVSFFSELPF